VLNGANSEHAVERPRLPAMRYRLILGFALLVCLKNLFPLINFIKASIITMELVARAVQGKSKEYSA